MNEIINFGARFSGRLEKEWLNAALNFVNYNECPLAVDTLLSYLYEYSIPISADEYDNAMLLTEKWGINEEWDDWKCLKKIIE